MRRTGSVVCLGALLLAGVAVARHAGGGPSVPDVRVEVLRAGAAHPSVSDGAAVYRLADGSLAAMDLRSRVERMLYRVRHPYSASYRPTIDGATVVFREFHQPPDSLFRRESLPEWREMGVTVHVADLERREVRELTDRSVHQRQPEVEGDRVVWVEGPRAGDPVVVVADLRGGEVLGFRPDGDRVLWPVIAGPEVLWTRSTAGADGRGSDMDVMAKPLDGGPARVLAGGPGRQAAARADGDRVVWAESRDGEDGERQSEIHLLDRATGERRVVHASHRPLRTPDLSGDRVVWQEGEGYDADIVLLDLETDRTRVLGTAGREDRRPRIDGRWVVWWRWPHRRGGGSDVVVAEIDPHPAPVLGSGAEVAG